MDKKDALQALKIDRDPVPPASGTRPIWRWVAIIAAIGVGLAVLGGFLLYPRAVSVHTEPVVVEGAGSSGAGSVLNASGYVVAEQQATVSSQITGMIRAVYVEEGMRVTKGEVLARLKDSAALASTAAAASQLRADRALVAQSKAQLFKDKRALSRTVILATQHLLSQSDLDNAEAAVNIDRADLAHARGQVQVDADNLRLARIELDYTVIRAPFSGVVTDKYAHPGEMISPAAVGGFTKTGVCMLVDMKSLEVDVDVNEAYIQRVYAGQRADAVLDAYPNWHIPAHVISVVPTANEEKATVKVRIAFNKLDPRILPQMGVQVWFYAKSRSTPATLLTRIEIPRSALHGSAGSEYVYLVEHGRVTRQAVKILSAPDGEVTVLAGLRGGERLVVSARARLHAGERVREQ